MKKLTLLFIFLTILITCARSSFAQPRIYETNSAYYLEAGGNAYSYSINVDHMFRINPTFAIAPRIGFSYTPNLLDKHYGISSFPFELNALIPVSGRSHYFELGPGYTYLLIFGRTNMKDNGGMLTFRLGYRYQRTDGGMVFRAGLLYLTNRSGDFSFSGKSSLIWPGISCGFAF
ncbi:hypothetical protein ACE1ET_19200 [Saccharicrinis sp. FJH62]|uniref:hypothetical protein n=1 Tax=Saccharicrinis sp. FJH62 TaxID=3344657 RepID=UPI0035D415C6